MGGVIRVGSELGGVEGSMGGDETLGMGSVRRLVKVGVTCTE